jgi:hypothetical protein
MKPKVNYDTFCNSVPFLWPINYNHAFWCTKFSTRLSLSWFWLKIFSFPWIHGVTHDHFLRASNCKSEWITTLRVIFRFDIDPAPSWWKFRIVRGAPSSWNQTPSNLVLSHFFKFLYFGYFVIGRCCF